MGRSLVVLSALVVTPGLAAAQAQPTVELSGVGLALQTTARVTEVTPKSAKFHLASGPVSIGLERSKGACTDAGLVVIERIGAEPLPEPAPPGYLPTSFGKDGVRFLCIDLRAEVVMVVVGPHAPDREVDALLSEIHRAAIASGGAPLLAGDEILLPRTGQTVRGLGAWKMMDGEGLGVRGDVLVSTDAIERSSLGWAVGLAVGPCPAGTVVFEGASDLFPADVGPVWIQQREVSTRWRAWTCITRGTETFTLHLVGPIVSDGPPDPVLFAAIAPALAAVARTEDRGGAGEAAADGGGGGVSSYVPSSGGSGLSRAGFPGQVAFYIGPLGVAREGADRGYGALMGAHMRLAKRGSPLAGMFDAELGYGDGEVLGEVRFGAGFYVGGRVVLDVIGGVSAGSIGPGAGADAFVQSSLGLYGRGGLVWLGAMRAFGTGGPDHDRFELRLGSMRNGAGGIFGVRYMRYGVDDATMERAGSAILLTIGGGLAAPP